MTDMEGNLLSVSDSSNSSSDTDKKEKDDSGIRDLEGNSKSDSYHSCESDDKSSTSSNDSSTSTKISNHKDSTSAVAVAVVASEEEGHEKVTVSVAETDSSTNVKVEEPEIKPSSISTEEVTSPATSEKKGPTPAVSRRAGRNGGRGSRGGGSGRGGRGNKKPGSLWGLFDEQQDTSDFHSSLFSQLQLQATYDNIANKLSCGGSGGNGKTLSDAGIRLQSTDSPVVPGYLSRDMMIQLSANINSGFFYINNALELLKQSQLELFQAKHLLERVYKSQHGDFDFTQQSFNDLSPSAASTREKGDLQGEDAVSVKSDCRSRSDVNSDITVDAAGGDSSPMADNFQVQLNPYQLMDVCYDDQVDYSPVTQFTIGEGGPGRTGRGRGRGGRGMQRRRKAHKEYYSSYNSEESHKGLGYLLDRLNSSSEQIAATSRDEPQAVVVLHDIQRILQKKGDVNLNRFPAATIEASLKRAEAKMKRSNGSVTSSKKSASSNSTPKDKMESPMEVDESDENRSSSKQVSNLEIPPENEENDEKGKDHVTAHDSTTINSDQSSTKNGRKNPHWKTMRVAPDILERIQLKLSQISSQSSQSEPEEDKTQHLSTSKSSQPSPTIKPPSAVSSQKVSPMIAHSKRKLLRKPQTLQMSKNSSIEITSVGSNKILKKVAATPPDEEMLDLTPDKDHCGCKGDKTPTPPKEEQITFFTTEVESKSLEEASSVAESEEDSPTPTTTTTSTAEIQLPSSSSYDEDTSDSNFNFVGESGTETEKSVDDNLDSTSDTHEPDVILCSEEEDSSVSSDDDDLFVPVKKIIRKKT